MGRTSKGISIAAFVVLLSTTPAHASLQLGQTGSSALTCMNGSREYVQPTVGSGNAYIVPGAGTITSWSTRASSQSGTTASMKVYRGGFIPNAMSTLQVVAADARAGLTPSAVNSYAVNIPVAPGDFIGLNSKSPGSCVTNGVAGDSTLIRDGDLAVGGTGNFSYSAYPQKVNIAATFVPSNVVTLGGTTNNKKAGSATVAVTVPNPGVVSVSGDGIANATEIPVGSTGPFTVQAPVQAIGAKRKRLRKKHKLTVHPLITYLPTAGDARSVSLDVKLKKKKKKRKKK